MWLGRVGPIFDKTWPGNPSQRVGVENGLAIRSKTRPETLPRKGLPEPFKMPHRPAATYTASCHAFASLGCKAHVFWDVERGVGVGLDLGIRAGVWLGSAIVGALTFDPNAKKWLGWDLEVWHQSASPSVEGVAKRACN